MAAHLVHLHRNGEAVRSSFAPEVGGYCYESADVVFQYDGYREYHNEVQSGYDITG